MAAEQQNNSAGAKTLMAKNVPLRRIPFFYDHFMFKLDYNSRIIMGVSYEG